MFYQQKNEPYNEKVEEEEEIESKVQVIEESSESENDTSEKSEKEKKNFDKMTANFEGQSQSKEDSEVFMAGSFAPFSNSHSIVENQLKSKVDQKRCSSLQQEGKENLDIASKQKNQLNIINLKNRESSLQRAAQKVDFSFQIESSPERSMKIMNTLGNTLSSQKGGGGAQKPLSPINDLFVVHEQASEAPTPKNQINRKLAINDNSSNEK